MIWRILQSKYSNSSLSSLPIRGNYTGTVILVVYCSICRMNLDGRGLDAFKQADRQQAVRTSAGVWQNPLWDQTLLQYGKDNSSTFCLVVSNFLG